MLQQKVLNLEHYLDVLVNKPGALAGSMPLEQWRAQGRWPASFDRFWEKLQQRRGRQDGTRAMIEVLFAGAPARLRTGAPSGGASAGAGRLGCGRDPLPTGDGAAGAACSYARLEVGWLNQYERPQPNLQDYDRLLMASAGEVIQ